ncbi:MAG TPA: T9SS type A sorting domain-containing protein, partial [Ignavibacteria bacterium]|nr:T9SS type A sorting domain-containing protein [Ignavibacteria bacterium]
SAIAYHTNKLLGLAATSSSMPEISRTTDGGYTWSSIDIGGGLMGACYITWIPDGPVVYIMGENGGIKRSTNNGINWVTMTTAGVTNLKHFDFIQKNNVVYGYAVSSNGSVIKLIDTLEILTGINSNSNIPNEFSLNQNYPNPFNPVTEIEYSVTKESFVKLFVYDALGREISMLVYETQKPGKYSVHYDGSDLNSGVYFYKLNAGELSQTRKMVLLK